MAAFVNGTEADAERGSLEELRAFVRQFLDDPRGKRAREQAARPLGQHVAEYAAYLASKGDGAKHVRDTTKRVEQMIVLTGAGTPADFTPSSVRAAMDALRCNPRKERPRRCPSTINHYLHAVRAFCRWLQQDGRGPASLIETVRPLNASLDRRRIRRPLTPEQAAKLIQTAAASGPVLGVPGKDRAMLYTVALTTGLRANELRTLTVGSFDLAGDPPTLTVAAAYSKHRRRDVLPLRADVAATLAKYLEGKPRDQRAFRLAAQTATMIKRDLAAAGIAYCEDGRYADFHAQRHTFVTLLVRGGANVKTTQHLARHSDPRMTLGLYSHTDTVEGGRALESLPDLAKALRWSHGESNPDLLNAIQHTGFAQPFLPFPGLDNSIPQQPLPVPNQHGGCDVVHHPAFG